MLLLDTGDKIVADGVVIDAQVGRSVIRLPRPTCLAAGVGTSITSVLWDASLLPSLARVARVHAWPTCTSFRFTP